MKGSMVPQLTEIFIVHQTIVLAVKKGGGGAARALYSPVYSH